MQPRSRRRTAKLFGVHRNTIRRWLKEGLPTIDRRPCCPWAALKAFLAERQEVGANASTANSTAVAAAPRASPGAIQRT